MGYSSSFKGTINYNKLIKKINFIKSNPKAIPYTTSYYKKRWSFNMSYLDFKKLKKNENYFVNIDTEFKKEI